MKIIKQGKINYITKDKKIGIETEYIIIEVNGKKYGLYRIIDEPWKVEEE